MNRVTVIGAGNGGVSMAAWLSLRGCLVSLYDKFDQALEGIKKAGGIKLKAPSTEGFAQIDTVTSDIAVALEGSDLIMVVTPAFAHGDVARFCAPFLTKGQKVILNPGRTAGAIEFRKTVKENNPDARFTVAEAQSLLFACRRTGPAEAVIYKIKKHMPLAALPAQSTAEALKAVVAWFPQFAAAGDVLETSLMNIGAVFHPTPSLLNIGRIDAGEDFEYYMQGISPSVASVLEELDAERVHLARAMGTNTMTVLEWLEDAYGTETGDASGIYEAVQRQEVYRGIAAPKDPSTRYISEDVPMGLVPLSELARLAGVPTPVMDSVITLAGAVHRRDYRKEGRNLRRLGLENMSVKEIRAFVTETA